MKYVIKEIENATRGMTWKDIGCNPTFGMAYIWSKESDNELSNFSDVIWDYDIKDIIEDCKKFGVKEFTISSTFSGLINTIAKFEEFGCVLDGIVKINNRYNYSDDKFINAFKMTVKDE